ncbi:hypothetical protein ABZ679_22860, partial [Streptomyces fimicarius]
FLKVHPKVAQAILRHSQISMTMDVYTHVVGDGARRARGCGGCTAGRRPRTYGPRRERRSRPGRPCPGSPPR